MSNAGTIGLWPLEEEDEEEPTGQPPSYRPSRASGGVAWHTTCYPKADPFWTFECSPPRATGLDRALREYHGELAGRYEALTTADEETTTALMAEIERLEERAAAIMSARAAAKSNEIRTAIARATAEGRRIIGR